MAPSKKKALVFWSSGKDSCLALHRTLNSKDFDVVGLVSTITKETQRVSFHGTPRYLLEAQARSIGLPLHLIELPEPCPNVTYEKTIRSVFSKKKEEGLTHVIFGDLFLKEIRKYREDLFLPLGVEPVFPLWEENTANLARTFLALGFRALVCSVNPAVLTQNFLARPFDESFLSELPKKIDPGGENGEFHTFVTDGPLFKSSLKIEFGTVHAAAACHWVDLHLPDPLDCAKTTRRKAKNPKE